MPKDTKTLGNNKARAWESLGFAHKKRLCQHFDTTSFQYYYIIKSKSIENKHDFSLPVSWNGIFYASRQSAAKPQ